MGVPGEHQARLSRHGRKHIGAVGQDNLRPAQHFHRGRRLLGIRMRGVGIVYPADCQRPDPHRFVLQHGNADPLEFAARLADAAPVIVVAQHCHRS